MKYPQLHDVSIIEGKWIAFLYLKKHQTSFEAIPLFPGTNLETGKHAVSEILTWALSALLLKLFQVNSNILLRPFNVLHNILVCSICINIYGKSKKNHSTISFEIVPSRYILLQFTLKCTAGQSNPVTTRISHWERIYLLVFLGIKECSNERHWGNQLACQPPRASFELFEFRIGKILISNQMHLYSEVNLYIAQALFNLLTFTTCNSVHISKKLADICLNTTQGLSRLSLSSVLQSDSIFSCSLC